MDQSSSFEDQLMALLPRLRRFAHGLSRNSADADDLTQATIERALRSRDQWQPGTRLDSWSYRIMRNLWIDAARSQSRRAMREAPEEEGLAVGQDPRDAMDAAVDLRRIMSAMSRLPDEQREIVALILVEGFGYREVSEMLGLPIGTVSSRLVRGRTALLAMVGEQ
ncbi:MAG TPA: RNA polymerase sigma factor [Sphingomicrobium sp.]|jgi:RNA polymerase sigma factor (sigma-70 family)|nr:RNA polymerase sigma factor [Sphingomicrobium sp.]